MSESQLFSARQAAAANGVNGFTAAPFVSYTLGGPVNHGPGYFHPDWKDFAPRIGIAYSPSFNKGVLGHVLGDRKTSIRAGGGIAYDRVLSGLSFEIDETAQMFAAQVGHNFGVPLDPISLASDRSEVHIHHYTRRSPSRRNDSEAYCHAICVYVRRNELPTAGFCSGRTAMRNGVEPPAATCFSSATI